MPKESTSLRLSRLDRDRIGKLRELAGAGTGQVVGEAIANYLAMLEMGQPTYRIVPSERAHRTRPTEAG